MSFTHSIKFRFTIWYLLVLGILLSGLSFGVYFSVAHSLTSDLDKSLELRASELRGVQDIIASMQQGEFKEELGEIVILYLYSNDNITRVSARDVDIQLDETSLATALTGQGTFETIENSEGQKLRLYTTPLLQNVAGTVMGRYPMRQANPLLDSAILVIGRSTENIDESLHKLLWTLGIASPLALVVAGGGGIFLANRALKPVDNIAQTAQQIEESGNLSQRIDVSTRDELGRLGSILNRMFERLEQAFNRQKEFTADASHELRAPLAIIQAESTLALQKERSPADYQASLGAISQEAANMAGLVDQLLTLARADAGKEQLVFEEVNLGDLLSELTSDIEVLCRERGIQFQFAKAEDVVVNGDHVRLKGLFSNILTNAIRYTPAEGSISLSMEQDGGEAVVRITDTGLGIPPEHLPHIFKRFYRVDKARSRAEGGSGLGLAICQQIAESHGGRIMVESQVGKGSTFSVFLPLAE